MTRLAVVAAAVLALPAARLLPETGAGLYLRLAAATAVLLLPGWLLARAFGTRGASATVVWSVAALVVPLAVTFAVGGSLSLALVLLAGIALAAAALPARRTARGFFRGDAGPAASAVGVFVAGAAFGIALWQIAGGLGGDALFHLARVRKLEELDALSLDAVGEFADGGLHPGYAFPLWHGFLALVARLAGVDPGAVVLHEASVLAPVAFLVVYEAGASLFRSAWAGAAVVAAQVALTGLAAGRGGGYASLALPATAARHLLVPALVALAFAHAAAPARGLLAGAAAGGLALTLVHPTYALFILVPLVGFWAARTIVAREDAVAVGAPVAALALATGGVIVWLLPIVRDTASHDPSDAELARALAHYSGYVDVLGERSYRLAPEVFGRSGAVAIAALALVPLAGLAASRRWAAWVLGGSLALLVVLLVPQLFTPFADAVSLSQARRAAGFLPFAFALAGGAAVLSRIVGVLSLPLALAAGIVLQRAYPGEFGYRLEDGGPALVTWLALAGGVAGLMVAVALRRRLDLDRPDAVAAAAVALFVLPVAVHGLGKWSERPARSGAALSTGLVEALRTRVREGDVVFSDIVTSYRIAAEAPVYVAAAPPGHVADTVENRPYERRDDVHRFFRTGDLAIPRRYGADWLVIDTARSKLPLSLQPAYSDPRYVLYGVE